MEQIPQTAEAISKLKSLQESYDELVYTVGDVQEALITINDILGTL